MEQTQHLDLKMDMDGNDIFYLPILVPIIPFAMISGIIPCDSLYKYISLLVWLPCHSVMEQLALRLVQLEV